MRDAGHAMKVTVEISGPLRRPSGRATFDVDLAEASTVADMLVAAGYSAGEARLIRVCRGAEILGVADAVHDKDTLTLFTPVGGG